MLKLGVCVATLVVSLPGCYRTRGEDDSGLPPGFALSVHGLTDVFSDPLLSFKGLSDVYVGDRLPKMSRHFHLGIVPIGAPDPTTTVEKVAGAYELASHLAECAVFRRHIDWAEFGPLGSRVSQRLEDIAQDARLARRNGMRFILLEFDPLPDRHHLQLPPIYTWASFASPVVQQAMRDYVSEVVRRVEPDYVSFGVEINGAYESDPVEFNRFVALHDILYDDVKAIKPDIRVMCSFNLEALQGLLAGLTDFGNHGEQWYLIDRFEPKLDVVAFSTLPFPIYARPLDLPADYLSRITQHTRRPIVFSEIAWTSAAEAGSDVDKQNEYAVVMARQALELPQVELMAWSLLFDAAEGSIFDSFPAFRFLGMLTSDGEPKPLLTTWAHLAQLPFEPLEGGS